MSRTDQEYIYGNTVRRESYDYYDEQQVRQRDEERRARRQAGRRTRESALRMDLPYLIMLTVASIAALIICCSYLRVQSSITTSIKNIEAQERHLEELRSENDALETRINSSTNLEHVFRVATEELGMVYARSNQIIVYDRTENEYVRQYDDIPQ